MKSVKKASNYGQINREVFKKTYYSYTDNEVDTIYSNNKKEYVASSGLKPLRFIYDAKQHLKILLKHGVNVRKLYDFIGYDVSFTNEFAKSYKKQIEELKK